MISETTATTEHQQTTTLTRTHADSRTTKKQKTLDDFLQDYKSKMALALPKHLNIDRMLRVVMTEIRKNPTLKECTPASFIGSVMQCCQLGLEPGNLGQAYLIPYKNSKLTKEAGRDVYECQFILGYRGMIELARRSGAVSSISAQPVHKNDHCKIKFGLVEDCEHIPNFEGVYVVVRFKDGGHQFDYMPVSEIDTVRDKSANYSYWVKSGSKDWNRPIWEDHYIEMAKKTVIRRMFKYWPISIELQQAISLDEAAEHGDQTAYIIEHELESSTKELVAHESKSEALAHKLSA